MSRMRALVVLPGRGSYQRDSLGSLAGRQSASVQAFDALREAAGRPTVSALDAAERFSSALHVAGENASILTAGIALADLERLDMDRVDVVAACGNSMGWYAALGFAGALPLPDCGTLVDSMGAWQAEGEHGVVGGQLVYPLTDDDWRTDPERVDEIEAAIATIPGLHWSIHLGGQAVLGGSEEAIGAAMQTLPRIAGGRVDFPLRLPLHSAFHTPWMGPTSERARRELQGLGWRSPAIPLIDGTGRCWRPRITDPAALRNYTLGPQITETFDFTAMIRTALYEYGPDVVVLPGPGGNLGGSIAQVMISCGWRGLHDRAAFDQAQQDTPVLVSLRRPEQAVLMSS